MVAKKTVKKAIAVAPVKPARKKSAKQAAGTTARERNKAAWGPDQKELASRPVDRSRGGVPTHFTQEEKDRLIPLILDKLEEGKSLWTAVREVEGAPTAPVFQRWVREDDNLTKLYAASRLRGYLMFAEDLQEIADNPHEGITTVTTRNEHGVEERITKEDMIGHRTRSPLGSGCCRRWFPKYLVTESPLTPMIPRLCKRSFNISRISCRGSNMISRKTLRLLVVATLCILLLVPFWVVSLFMKDNDDSSKTEETT